jgi:hypothetical protein
MFFNKECQNNGRFTSSIDDTVTWAFYNWYGARQLDYGASMVKWTKKVLKYSKTIIVLVKGLYGKSTLSSEL